MYVQSDEYVCYTWTVPDRELYIGRCSCVDTVVYISLFMYRNMYLIDCIT